MKCTVHAICLWLITPLHALYITLYPLEGDGMEKADFCGSDFALFSTLDLSHYVIEDSSISIF